MQNASWKKWQTIVTSFASWRFMVCLSISHTDVICYLSSSLMPFSMFSSQFYKSFWDGEIRIAENIQEVNTPWISTVAWGCSLYCFPLISDLARFTFLITDRGKIPIFYLSLTGFFSWSILQWLSGGRNPTLGVQLFYSAQGNAEISQGYCIHLLFVPCWLEEDSHDDLLDIYLKY